MAARAGGSSQQKCDKIENYFNDEMKSRIRDKTVSWEARCEYIGECLHRFGITVASEQILKRCAALALLEGEQNIDAMPAQRKQSMAKHVQAAMKSKQESKPYPLAHIQCYPPRPAELPEQMQAHAYGDERPSDWHVPPLDHIAKSIPYRGTHRSLRDDNQRPAPSNKADPMQLLQLRMMQQFMSQSFRGSPAVAVQLLATMNNETMGDGISLQINQNAARSRQRRPSSLALLRSPSSQLSLQDGMTDVGTSRDSGSTDLPSEQHSLVPTIGEERTAPLQLEGPAGPTDVVRDAVLTMETAFATAYANAKKKAAAAKTKSTPRATPKATAKTKATSKAKGKAEIGTADVLELTQEAIAADKEATAPTPTAGGKAAAGKTKAKVKAKKAAGKATAKATAKPKAAAAGEVKAPADAAGEDREEAEAKRGRGRGRRGRGGGSKKAKLEAAVAVASLEGVDADGGKTDLAMKKPAGKAKLEAAEPAAPDFSDLVVITPERKAATTRGAFTSRAYDTTKTRAKRMGIFGDAASAHAKKHTKSPRPRGTRWHEASPTK